MAKRAVCVGINQFPHIGASATLHGCVNDAHDMAAMLASRGFASGDVTVLTDSGATKTEVMSALRGLVTSAAPGDHLVFSFSSHGTQVPDVVGPGVEANDEPDHVDEAFACHDIAAKGGQWDLDTVIVDDELRDLFATVPSGVLFEVFLDTCHSGSGLRELRPGVLSRFLPPPRPLTAPDTAANRSRGGLTPVAPSPAAPKSELTPTARGSAKPVLYAACRPEQTSADATFDNRASGAFTYYFLKALAADPARTRAEIYTAVTAALGDGDFDQRPTLEAPSKAKKTPVGAPW